MFSNGIRQVTVLHCAGQDNVAALSQNPIGSITVGESQVATVKSIPSTVDQVLKSNAVVCDLSYDLSEEQM